MPRAYVVLSEGMQASEKEIQKWMEQHVTRHKFLTGGVKFVEAIPKNPVSQPPMFLALIDTFVLMLFFKSGKILRKLLRDQAKEEISRSSIKARL